MCYLNPRICGHDIMPFRAKQLTTSIATRPAFWVGALLSCGVGLALYFATAVAIEGNAQQRFDNMARSVRSTLEGRIKSYNDVLRGSASLFQTTTSLTRDQFHRYVDGLALEKAFPGIETINFARYVSEAERPAFEAAMRKELAVVASGYPPFRITPPGRRGSYTVLTYIEPISAWGNRFGADISARGNVPALEEARDTGDIAPSGLPIAPLSGRNHTGLAMRLPIYRSDLPATTVQERRAAYIGSVGIGFSVNKLVQGVLEQMPVHNVRMALTDITGQMSNAAGLGRTFVLFDSQAAETAPPPSPAVPDRATFVASLPMEFGKRVWEARFSVSKANLYTGFEEFVPWLAMLAGFVSTLLLYTLYHTLASSRRGAVALAESMTRELRASEAKLQMSNENLRRLAAHADNIKEGERKRIAREIHDDLGQNLLALRIEADMLAARTGDRHPRLHARAHSTLQQIDTTIKSVRQIINDLRPTVLDLGLNAAVDWQIADFRRRTGIDCELVENHRDIKVSDQCATALFRILQESLSNISRHARATRVRVELRIERDEISMTVGDNGVGLLASGRHKPGSFGLVGIEERINILGGAFSITSSPGAGTTVHVSVPFTADVAIPAALNATTDAHPAPVALA
jgi:signal transduction histidine kinase/CHASE1-domain containing sensor protein